jgi:hypothetical protein
MKKINLTTLLMTVLIFTGSSLGFSQKAVLVDITTNPLKIAGNALNGAMQIQTGHFPYAAILGNVFYQVNKKDLKQFIYQSQSITSGLELRLYPFGQRIINFEKKRYNLEMCAGKYSCLVGFGLKSRSLLDRIMKGFYIAPGFENYSSDITLIPKKELEATKEKYSFAIQNKSFTLSTGLQVRILHLTVEAGYRVVIGKPHFSGDYDVFKDSDFLNVSFPAKFRLTHGFHTGIGINF